MTNCRQEVEGSRRNLLVIKPTHLCLTGKAQLCFELLPAAPDERSQSKLLMRRTHLKSLTAILTKQLHCYIYISCLQNFLSVNKPSSSAVTLQMIIKCRRPSVLKLYFGLSLSSQESLYHVTVALSKDNSHSNVAAWRSSTSMLWMHLVN